MYTLYQVPKTLPCSIFNYSSILMSYQGTSSWKQCTLLTPHFQWHKSIKIKQYCCLWFSPRLSMQLFFLGYLSNIATKCYIPSQFPSIYINIYFFYYTVCVCIYIYIYISQVYTSKVPDILPWSIYLLSSQEVYTKFPENYPLVYTMYLPNPPDTALKCRTSTFARYCP